MMIHNLQGLPIVLFLGLTLLILIKPTATKVTPGKEMSRENLDRLINLRHTLLLNGVVLVYNQ